MSAEAFTDPNSNTVTSMGRRGTSTAPFMPGSSVGLGLELCAGLGLGLDSDTGWGWCGVPLNQDSRPMSGCGV